MKMLVSVRHGDGGAGLSGLGRRQSQALANQLYQKLGNCKPLVLSSTRDEAEETAGYIADKFGVKVVTDYGLHTYERDEDHWRIREALEAIEKRAKGAEVVIVVTHRDSHAAIIRRYGREQLNVRPYAKDFGPATGFILYCASHFHSGRCEAVEGEA